ncbi:DUF4097 family beta strand repeat-containing protein [Streptomyces sp. RKAG293]|uniref:DUF4097 family beta strand repeat-containing protein n=1 Tax=Streptomyces sp. RKAG293 TaxID=2893403 RepID=UPI002034A145|nr:DUF4097 family beta strand repeat-containing protein [Streptomyces sp. RKAG293]MCM2424275.1 DUF4097 domain-containing protein [Streptomyces sp. RKAG293]
MSTQMKITAEHTGPISLDLSVQTGTVRVTVDPAITQAVVTVATDDDEGLVADAIRAITSTEFTRAADAWLKVTVPQIPGSSGSVQMGGSSFHFNGGVGMSVVSVDSIGVGMQMIGNDVYMGGKKVIENGRVIAATGTVVTGTGRAGTLTVDVTLPPHSSLRLSTTSASLQVRSGDLDSLDVQTVSGSVEAQGVGRLTANTTSGSVYVDSVDTSVAVTSVSGAVEIGAYSGSSFTANSVSGAIRMTATPAASGSVSARTVSGAIATRAATHLDVRTRSVSGRIDTR